MTHYEIVEQAILYLHAHAKEQPDLAHLARYVGLSPFHLQRVFREWAGVSPKKFLQSLNIEHAKQLLSENRSVLDTSLSIGLSGPSRLYDLFITTEGMTPGAYKSGGAGLAINYSFADTLFGHVLVASTPKGVCYLAFYAVVEEGLADLRSRFPKAALTQSSDQFQREVLRVFEKGAQGLTSIKLHLTGTPFQLKVWQALLHVPVNRVVTYADIASAVDQPRSVRAVGTAVGRNPIAYLIPCHRVIRSTGMLGGYRWGLGRKRAMLAWEEGQG